MLRSKIRSILVHKISIFLLSCQILYRQRLKLIQIVNNKMTDHVKWVRDDSIADWGSGGGDVAGDHVGRGGCRIADPEQFDWVRTERREESVLRRFNMSKFVWIQSGVMLLVEGGRGQGSVLCGAYNLNVGPYQSSRECLDIFNFHPTRLSPGTHISFPFSGDKKRSNQQIIPNITPLIPAWGPAAVATHRDISANNVPNISNIWLCYNVVILSVISVWH